MNNELIIVGRLASPYGLQGWLKIISFTNPPQNLLDYKTIQIQHHSKWHSHDIEGGKCHGKFLVIKIPHCNDRETAREYTNDLIAVPRHTLTPLKKDEYYWADLIGLSVINQKNSKLGVIDSLLETGSNDVMVVIDEHNHERCLPYTSLVVKQIDLQNKIMIVDWDENF